MKTLFFECNMGAAGDMLMSALYEICEQKDVFLSTMNRVFAPYHITLSAESVTKCGVLGTSLHVSIDGEELIATRLIPLTSRKRCVPMPKPFTIFSEKPRQRCTAVP